MANLFEEVLVGCWKPYAVLNHVEGIVVVVDGVEQHRTVLVHYVAGNQEK